MDNFSIGLRFGGGAVSFAAGGGGVNPCMFPACQQILQAWMPPCSPQMMPGYMQAPPFFYPMAPDMGGFPMPNPGWGSPFPFSNPFQSMNPAPFQPPHNPGFGGYRPSIPNYGASYRYPEYAMLQERARENGTLDGTPITPRSSFQEDQFSTDALSRLNQRAAGRVMDEARNASPREFNALQRNEGQLQGFLQAQAEQGRGFSPAEINRMRAQGIENLFQDGQVGQGVGQANREYLELLDAWERSEANQQLKYGVGPLPGLSENSFRESPFNPHRREAPVPPGHHQGPRPQPAAPQPPAPQPSAPQPPKPQPRPSQHQLEDIRRLEGPGTKPQPQPQNKPAPAAPKDQPAAPNKPAPKPYDPNKDANSLYSAMHGGMFGAGTDEAALFKALDGKSKEQIDKLAANYKDHYGRDLTADIKGELSGKDLQRAEALLKGNQAAADATSIRQGVGTLWNDDKQIHQALEGKTAEQRSAIAAEYKKQTGKELKTELTREMSGTDRDQAMALLEGNNAKADAAKLQRAMKGMGTDEAAIMETLRGKSKEEREAITREFNTKYNANQQGPDLNKRLDGELSGAELDQARALLKGDNAAADAAQLKHAMHGGLTGLGTDKEAIESALEGKSQKQREDILKAYSKYGDLKQDLKGDLSGNDMQKSEALLERGKLSSAEQLKFALEGAGTDEEAVKKALQGKSKQEIEQIRKEYGSLTQGGNLDQALASDMDGRDLFEARQALKGRAETVDEAVQRANEVREFERGGESNQVSRGVMDFFSDKGKTLDTNTDRINESYNKFDRLVAEGRLDEARAEKSRLQELTGFQNADVENYREAKDAAADTAGTVAATAAGVAVVVATAGTATPLVATAAMAAGAGAGARVVTSGLIQGEGYGLESGLKDAGLGAIDGGTAIIGMGAAGTGAKAAVKAGQEGAEVAARQALKEGGELVGREAVSSGGQLVTNQAVSNSTELIVRQTGEGAAQAVINKAEERLVIQGAGDILDAQGKQWARSRLTQGVKDGALGGSIGAGGSTALNDETWDHGLEAGLTRVGAATVLGAGVGGVAGGAFAGRGGAKEWANEVDLYRNRANFNLLDDPQKAKFASLAENHAKGAAFVDGGPSQAVDHRLISMLRDGTVDQMDHRGATVVDNLHKLDNQTMARGLTNGGVMDEVLETVTRPGVIHQDTKGSCTVTTLEYLHVKKDPSDYVRVVGDLTSESGETTLKNGETILRNPTGLDKDGTSRSSIDRIYQSTMMDYGGRGHYDNQLDAHIQVDGKAGSSGLGSPSYNRIEEGVLGGQWRNHYFDKADGQAARDAFEKQVSEAAGKGEHVPISMRFAPKADDLHSNHMLSVYKTDDEFVYLRNPWGKGETGGADGPPREVLDRQGNIRMKKQDFYDRLNGYDVQTSQTGKAPVDLGQVKKDMLSRFRKQAEEYSDDRWMQSTPDYVYEKWTPEQRELHRTKLHERANNILRDLEAGRDIHDVAEQYKLSDHYGLGDKHGRSEQYINRTTGQSNTPGVDKTVKKAEAPPPPPPPPPPPQNLRPIQIPTNREQALRAFGLGPGASAEEIKGAYRRLANANHPDKFPDQGELATENMKALNRARDLLKG